MITKEQAMTADHFHFTGKGDCHKIVGPRGGETVKIVRVRRNGKTQTWKTRPEEFRVPIKYGLYECGEITEKNATYFHVAGDCEIEKF